MKRLLLRTAGLAAWLAVAAATAEGAQDAAAIADVQGGPARASPGHIPQSMAKLRRIRLCGPPLAPPPEAVDREQRSAPDTPLIMKAEAIFADTPLYRLRGNAELQRLDQRLRTETVNVDEAEGTAHLPGHFAYSAAGLHLRGETGEFDIEANRLAVERANFRVYPHAHGAARTLTSDRQAGKTELHDVRYSTCPPGEELWWLHAGSLSLDHESGVGVARHARVEIGGAPVLYTPYLRFPIDDQPRTGLLPPSFGQSESDGSYYTQPLYIRLAPNYDLTLEPTYYSRRGAKIAGEGRYLRPSLEGDLRVAYLPEDEAYADRLREETGETVDAERWALDWRHEGDLPASIDYRLDVERVSDPDYLRDFASDLVGSSDAELESRAWVQQSSGDHRWSAEAQHWQNLRPDSRQDPYRRLPAVRYQYTPGQLPGGLAYRLEGEAVRFDLPQGATRDGGERPVGWRYHVNPRLSWPVREQAFFIEPGLSLHHTQYDLTRAAGSQRDTSLSRTVPIASLDAGLFLERPFSLGDRPFLQTLEPRIYYLYAPYRDQSGYPNFDTTERGNTVAQLFRDNRFAGIDRIGDADQITVAVTTRLLDVVEGNEPLRASIGQVYYRDDRRVVLEGDPADEPRLSRNRSDIFANAQARLPGGVSLRGEYRYNPVREAPAATAFIADWQHSPAPGALINLGYRLREETRRQGGEPVLETTQELVEASAVAPLGTRWRAVGAWRYSRLERTNLELVGGLEYRECCWAARGLFRRFRRGVDLQMENTFMLEFELTGLGRLGQDTASFLEEVVPDYEETVF